MQALPTLLTSFESTSANIDTPNESVRGSSHWSHLGQLPFVDFVVDRWNAKSTVSITL